MIQIAPNKFIISHPRQYSNLQSTLTDLIKSQNPSLTKEGHSSYSEKLKEYFRRATDQSSKRHSDNSKTNKSLTTQENPTSPDRANKKWDKSTKAEHQDPIHSVKDNYSSDDEQESDFHHKGSVGRSKSRKSKERKSYGEFANHLNVERKEPNWESESNHKWQWDYNTRPDSPGRHVAYEEKILKYHHTGSTTNLPLLDSYSARHGFDFTSVDQKSGHQEIFDHRKPGVSPSHQNLSRPHGKTSPGKGMIHLGPGQKGSEYFDDTLKAQHHAKYKAMHGSVPKKQKLFEGTPYETADSIDNRIKDYEPIRAHKYSEDTLRNDRFESNRTGEIRIEQNANLNKNNSPSRVRINPREPGQKLVQNQIDHYSTQEGGGLRVNTRDPGLGRCLSDRDNSNPRKLSPTQKTVPNLINLESLKDNDPQNHYATLQPCTQDATIYFTGNVVSHGKNVGQENPVVVNPEHLPGNGTKLAKLKNRKRQL